MKILLRMEIQLVLAACAPLEESNWTAHWLPYFPGKRSWDSPWWCFGISQVVRVEGGKILLLPLRLDPDLEYWPELELALGRA